MRVLMLSEGVTPDKLGGSYRYVRELSAALARGGADVTILTKRADPGPPDLEHAEDGVTIVRYQVPQKSLWAFAAAYPLAVADAVRRHLRRAPRDTVLHAHFPLVAAVPALSRRPFVYTFHAPMSREIANERQGSYALARAVEVPAVAAFRAVERLVVDRARRLTVLSEFMRGELARLSSPAAERASVIPGGLDLHRFSPGPGIVDPWAADAEPLLFTARRLTPRTGVVELVRAMRRIREALPRARLAVAGAGHLERHVREEVARLGVDGAVRLLGRVSEDELVGWYRAAQVVVMPTVALEGFGLTTAESLACGTPVVGTPVGANPELLRELDPALVAADVTPEAIARAIVDVAGDRPRLARIAEASRRRVDPEMGWDAVAERFLDEYAQAHRSMR